MMRIMHDTGLRFCISKEKMPIDITPLAAPMTQLEKGWSAV